MRKAVISLFTAALIAVGTACTVHTDSKARDDAREAAQQAKEDAKRATEDAKEEARRAAEEAKEEGQRAADEGRRAAEDARREAEDARREAQDQAAEAQRNANAARQEAQADARSERDRDSDMGRSASVVNLNNASVKDIASATGLAPEVAQKIVDARPYTSKRDLVSKKIVDDQTYWRIQKNVTVMSK